MLYWLPIEPIEERYSAQWMKWFDAVFKITGVPYKTVRGKRLTDRIETGSFLDVYDTHYWKMRQIEELTAMFYNKEIKDGDWIFVGDLWFPGLEALAYIRDASGIKFKIAGCLHAGSYDEHDRLHVWGTDPWASYFENCLFELADLIFVATYFHKDLVQTFRYVDENKVVVTGFPIYDNWTMPTKAKKNIVVFPHRLDPEKQPDQFDMLALAAPMPPDWLFYKTKDSTCATKRDYYDILNVSKIAVSFALQETWGIAMQEAVISRCYPVVPNRLSYVEMYPDMFRYDSFPEAQDLVVEFAEKGTDAKYIFELETLRQKFLIDGGKAIYNMLNAMELI